MLSDGVFENKSLYRLEWNKSVEDNAI